MKFKTFNSIIDENGSTITRRPRTLWKWATTSISIVIMANLTGCILSQPRITNPPPLIFQSPPELGDVVNAINANTQRVKHIHSENIQLSRPGNLGTLNATLDFERVDGGANLFRLSGSAFGTRQMDLGSNPQVYWLWVKQQPPTVFWGRHEQFGQSAATRILPMPPSWIADAFGLLTIDPNRSHEVFASATPGLIQVRSRISTPTQGELLRVLEIDERRALVVQQQIYDTNNRLLAVADTSDFTHEPLHNVTLPRAVKINLPPSGLAFNFSVSSYQINQPPSDPQTLWTMPRMDDHQYRDLANPDHTRGLNLDLGSMAMQSGTAIQPPIRPSTHRAAWRQFPPFSVFR